jgi:sulfite exporter TauE/SafE
MAIALMVVGLVMAYTFVGAISTKLALTLGERRGWDDTDISSLMTGVFWPLAWPVIGMAMFAVGTYWLVDGGYASVARKVARIRRERRERLAEKVRVRVPMILVPPGAIMTLESYRTLKPMVTEFERTMPLLERE